MIAFLLGEYAAAVFLDVEAQLPRTGLAVAEHGAEILIIKFHAVFLRRAVGHVAHQLGLLIGADEQRRRKRVEPALLRGPCRLKKAHFVAFDAPARDIVCYLAHEWPQAVIVAHEKGQLDGLRVFLQAVPPGAVFGKGMDVGIVPVAGQVDPIRALEAVMDGYEVMPMMDAAAIGDIFVSVTGCKDVITLEHCEHMKDGAIVSNAGHFNVEIDMEALDRCADEIYEARHNIDAYRLPNGKTIYVIAQGRLVNLAAGDGHPAEIMDMSFAVQAMSAEYLVRTRGQLRPGVVSVPAEIDDNIARRKLKAMGVSIDSLSCSQKEYLNG